MYSVVLDMKQEKVEFSKAVLTGFHAQYPGWHLMMEFWISTIILSAACIWYKSSCWSSCFWSGFQYVQCCMKQSVVKHAGEEILTNETYLRIKAVFTTYLCCCLQSYYLQLPPHKLACEVRLSYALAFKVKLLLPCLVICCQFVCVILTNNVWAECIWWRDQEQHCESDPCWWDSGQWWPWDHVTQVSSVSLC